MITNSQQNAYDNLLNNLQCDCRVILHAELKESEHGTVSFIIRDDFKVNPLMSSKSYVGIIGKRGAITYTLNGE